LAALVEFLNEKGGDGGPDMSYRQRDDTLVLTDVSVAAARNINRNDLMTKVRTLVARLGRSRNASS
jgi:hypothetical protein